MDKKKNKLIKLLILGSTGQLGSQLFKDLKKNKRLKIIKRKKEKLNLLKLDNIKQKLKIINPDIIINCSAFTNVELAESKMNEAKKINSDSLKIISKYCKKTNINLIHFSTDYVFFSKKKKKFHEKDYPNAKNFYGYTKILGENNIKSNMKKYHIFRISWLYSNYRKNFYTKIKDKILNKKIKKIFVVDDQFGCPMSTEYISDIIQKNIMNIYYGKIPFGIYHLGLKNFTSWYNFARYINLKMKIKNKIFKIKTNSINLKAKRSNYSILRFSKYKLFVKNKKTWQEIFNHFINKV